MRGDNSPPSEAECAASPLPAAPGDSVRPIGYSVNGRPLIVRFFGSPDARLRVLAICGQHGDERAIRRALRSFRRNEAERLAAELPELQFALLETANPDGYAARTRSNAQGIDLNRDHLWLRAPETRAIHRFAVCWRPHFVVDLHNYPSRREHLVREGVRLPWDVAIEFPTNPASAYAHGHPLLDSLVRSLERLAARERFRFGRYGLHGADGSMRHGTPRLGDARNTIALKFDVPTVLIEARNPSRNDPSEDRQAVRDASAAAFAELLRWAVRQKEALLESDAAHRVERRVPLRYSRATARTTLLPFVELRTDALHWLPCARYRPDVEGRRSRRVPDAYAIPPSCTALTGFLEGHGFVRRIAGPDERFGVERAAGRPAGAAVALPGFAIFSCRQRGGRLLALLLESESRSTILDCPEFRRPEVNGPPPVRRVLSAGPDGGTGRRG